jgi:hypothetical protein
MIKEEKYIIYIYIGIKKHVLRVQEILWGLEPWPERFRPQISASSERKANTV